MGRDKLILRTRSPELTEAEGSAVAGGGASPRSEGAKSVK